eukprot:gnl/MRDRNA2_/MRDRNA2_106119_c0_seq1.p1 gnl/MRDRNA2_/MRDRNA2_106119_c0~~gnl/MRDRNA2_/MRDRNA2_106119_c0_seq1.p1  ORF type:complete len:296 (-),score=83.11 gnl/MRDRNA2_/MRDRNA2_106119_c0_seq1:13-831(-)
MDDEAPLAALAGGSSKPSYDDDTPLAALATNKPKVQKSIAKMARPGVPASKGKGKGKGKGSSSSGSDSSSGSSSSSDSEDGGGKRRATRKALKKAADDGIIADDSMRRAKDKRSPKEKLVADILSRWWYGDVKDWPPKDAEYYSAELKKRKLRQVDIANWEWEDDTDDKGFRKCYGLAQFFGVYRDSTGELLDLRPMKDCPCYDNYMKKEMHELYEMLHSCLEGQIKALDKSVYDETKLKAELSSRLAKVREHMHKFRDLQGKKTQLPPKAQ